MKSTQIGVILMLSLLAVPQAKADAIYSTTDLGNSVQLLTEPAGQVYGVTNSSGNVVYAFDKSPVTAINIGPTFFGADQYQYLTLQNGAYQVGYALEPGSGSAPTFYPTFEGAHAGWFVLGFGLDRPVADINSQGQAVGISLFASGDPTTTYAAFSNPHLQVHGWNASVTDNLNNYIVPIPGVTLTSAFKIDDLGRILAKGSNGDDYLLTPTALGAPATIPEPSTAITFWLVTLLIGVRSIQRRNRLKFIS